MAITKGAVCKPCNSHVMASRDSTGHLFHLLMSLLTIGMWTPIWFLLALSRQAYRCSRCGRKV